VQARGWRSLTGREKIEFNNLKIKPDGEI